jgi:two-component system LytT family sensor kinase
MNWIIKKNRIVKSHILFWGLLWLLYFFFFSYNSNNKSYVFTISTFLTLITTFPTYLTVNVLIPKYLSKKKYKWFGIFSFFTFLFTIFCIILLLMLIVAYTDDIKFEDLPPMSRNYAYLTILVYLVVVFASFLSIWRKNAQVLTQNNELQNLLLTAKIKTKEQELDYLKNQIHPHFLFNTLNTIYGFALKKSSETPNIILKLSNLLDYILYQANKSTVPLIDEIIHLEGYIDLERIRFSDTLKVNFIKEIENQDVLIAPMLLLPFVENVFKHGSIVDGFLSIIIDISVTNNTLKFSIKNTFKQTTSKDGLGLKNIKERLDILYPTNYNLKIISNPNWFEVLLEINHLTQKRYV